MTDRFPGTMKKPLPIAAQAVLDAAWEELDWVEMSHLRWALSASLRAAADQIQFEGQLGMTAYGGHAQAQSQLLAIAAELDGTTTNQQG